VLRAFHPPAKHDGNPVIEGEGGYVCVVRDGDLFRMWYQTYEWKDEPDKRKGKVPVYAIAYAESRDGIHWELPRLGLYEWKGGKDRGGHFGGSMPNALQMEAATNFARKS